MDEKHRLPAFAKRKGREEETLSKTESTMKFVLVRLSIFPSKSLVGVLKPNLSHEFCLLHVLSAASKITSLQVNGKRKGRQQQKTHEASGFHSLDNFGERGWERSTFTSKAILSLKLPETISDQICREDSACCWA